MSAPTAVDNTVATSMPSLRLNARILRSFIDRRRTPEMIAGLVRTYDQAVQIRIPRQPPTVLITSPELSRQVLVEGRSIVKGRVTQLMSVIVGDGLLSTIDRDRHRRHRRLVQPAFHPGRMAGYAAQMVAAATALDATWEAAGPGAVRDAGDDMVAVALGILGDTLLGADTARDVPVVRASLNAGLHAFERLVIPGVHRLLATRLPWAERFRTAVADLRGVVDAAVTERAHATPADFAVDALLAARDDDGTALSEAELRDEVMTLFLAGHETTAGALTWVWFYLARNPDARAALDRELDTVLAGRMPTFDDLRSLPYTTAVFAEALRLRPPAWMLDREVVTPFQINGETIPVGSTILVSPFALQHDPTSWPNPERFDPSRWITADGAFSEDAPGQPRGSWLPFGGGTRVCIGENFAWIEGVLVLATLARHWSPTLASAADPGIRAAVTLRPDKPIRLRLARR